jgi:ADP-ribose pyrophosphatase YjhB (NUDIX family)
MKMEDYKHFATEGYRVYVPNISIGCALLGFNDYKLKVLLLRWKGLDKWAIPGGFMMQHEDADEGAARILKERTGLDVYLQQYHTYTSLNRFTIDEPSQKKFKETFGIEVIKGHWYDKRVIGIGYYGLAEYAKVTKIELDMLTTESQWCPVDDIPENMLFNHHEMIGGALKALQRDVAHEPVCLKLLPSQFTMHELQCLYESILGYSLDRGNFRKKMLNAGILRDMGECTTRKAHKTPHMYSFDVRAYKKALQSGIIFKLQ